MVVFLSQLLPGLGSFFSPLISAALLPGTSMWDGYLTPSFPSTQLQPRNKIRSC